MNRRKMSGLPLLVPLQNAQSTRREFLAATGSATLATTAGRVSAAAAPAAKPIRVIDTHLHLFNTKLEGANGVPRYIGVDATVEAAIAAMDRGGVDKAFLISYAAEDVAVQIRQRGVKPDAIKD